ncbi:uncharacterized protein At4g38062-like [Rutidosis leptorrhynchoides]|uniref:uncharacterized protein At4g38062-like n=1 Tax=Rutidosis leptorrhynchoides TaxID=125765 RepID=UPI003A98F0EE
MTEKVYEELDDAKAEIEKLKSEYSVKSDLCDNLKRSHSDQIKRIQELNLKLEQQAQEIETKADEVYAANQLLEDIKCKLKEKENVIKSFSSANDKLCVDFKSKLRESEEEKEKLTCTLDEANAKISDLERQNRAFMDKIEVLTEGIVSVSQKKCASESKMAKTSKQMRENGDMFEKLEEEKVKLEEELKWRNEQFKHLEEAYKKIRDNLHLKEKEWDMEKSSIRDHASSLETKMDSQIRVSEVLKRRLETCSQALACEENRRKDFEIQVSDLVNSKSELEQLISEKECKITKLEEENQELVFSFNEGENKIKSLEQIHDVKEAEWNSRFEKVVADLSSCRYELESKEARLKEIMTELDDYNSQVVKLAMEKEVMIVAMKSILIQARSNFDEEKRLLQNEIESHKKQLLQTKSELDDAKNRIKSDEAHLKVITAELNDYITQVLQLTMEKEESALMMVTMKSTLMETGSNTDEEKNLMQKLIESQKKQLMQTKDELVYAYDLLDKANEELDQSYCEVNEVEFELQIWKSIAEKLKVSLEVNQQWRRELEASLLAQVAMEINLKEENGSLICVVKEKDRIINDLEEKFAESKQNSRLQLDKKLDNWEQEWVTKELEAAILAQLEYQRIHEFEKQNFKLIVDGKDQRMNELEKIMSCLEEELDHSSDSFSSQLEKMQADMNVFHEVWEKTRTAVFIKEIEAQEKSLIIKELEKDLEKQVKFVKNCWLTVKKVSSENENLMDIIGNASQWIHKLSNEDGQVIGTLRNIMSSFDDNRPGHAELNDQFDPAKENLNLFQSPKRNMVEDNVDERSPLRTLNG